MKILCEIYKSKKDEELYVYVDKTQGLQRVPSQLVEKINTKKSVMSLLLSAERKLARADVAKVMADIQEKGFYLQMPPLEQHDHPQQTGDG